MLKRKCSHCNEEFEYELFANFILFCPNCKKLVHMECEYGYSSVVPCAVLLGKEKIAMVTSTGLKYFYDSKIYSVHIALKNTSLKALEEASVITSELLEQRN